MLKYENFIGATLRRAGVVDGSFEGQLQGEHGCWLVVATSGSKGGSERVRYVASDLPC